MRTCLLLLWLSACGLGTPSATPTAAPTSAVAPPCGLAAPYDPTPVEAERDEIFMLVAYGVALKDWQSVPRQGRGANVAAVLVDRHDRLRCWSRNAQALEGDVTQHAERRLITDYLLEASERDLGRHRVYTTLEPCPMCAGTMLMSYVERVVYGHRDLLYGGLLEHLADGLGPGSCTGAIHLRFGAVTSPIRDALDAATASGRPVIGFLYSDQARAIYEQAAERLSTYVVTHAENAPILASARSFLDGVPADEPRFPYDEGCVFPNGRAVETSPRD